MEKVILTPVTVSELQSLIVDAVSCAIENKEPNEAKVSMEDGRITRKELSLRYKICYSTIHSLMRQGRLPFEKIGRKTLFKISDVENCFSKDSK